MCVVCHLRVSDGGGVHVCVISDWTVQVCVISDWTVHVCVISDWTVHAYHLKNLRLGLHISMQVPILRTNITFLMSRPVVIITMLVSEGGGVGGWVGGGRGAGETESKCVIGKEHM